MRDDNLFRVSKPGAQIKRDIVNSSKVHLSPQFNDDEEKRLSVAQVPTLTEKGRINKEMLMMYPGLNEKITGSQVFPYSKQEKIKDNVYRVILQKEKRTSPQMSSLSKSPLI